MAFQSFLRHRWRVVSRLVWFGGELLRAALGDVVQVALAPRDARPAARAYWLQRGCRRVLRIFHVQLRTAGPIPARGLLVCNHLSYLDILVLGAVAPTIFVAKREVKHWPVFGW